mmetsp:Transcript_17769/g.47279  ORF Transcript_17769/g.47279 Transcript_17769/m.47279 type:complete len:200 (-) Transcript_17769:20-619(-)
MQKTRLKTAPRRAFSEQHGPRAGRLPRPSACRETPAAHTQMHSCACTAAQAAPCHARHKGRRAAAADTRAPQEAVTPPPRHDNTRAGGRRHLHADERRGPRVPRGRRDRVRRRPPDGRQQHRDERRRADQPRRAVRGGADHDAGERLRRGRRHGPRHGLRVAAARRGLRRRLRPEELRRPHRPGGRQVRGALPLGPPLV